jgi:hypothetical protein
VPPVPAAPFAFAVYRTRGGLRGDQVGGADTKPEAVHIAGILYLLHQLSDPVNDLAAIVVQTSNDKTIAFIGKQ